MNYFTNNLKKLATKYSQKDIAVKTDMSPASIVNYISGVSEPSAKFLLKLKSKFSISIDDFLTKDLSFEDKIQDKELDFSKFIGNYIVYYYNSSAYKGKVGSYNYDVLTYGIISVFNQPNEKNNVSCLGIFMLSRKSAELSLKHLNELTTTKQIQEFYQKQERIYRGNITQNTTQVFIDLRNDNDTSLIILNNPPSPKKYIGGIGTVNSISRGREHVPCVQYIVFSNVPFKFSDGEIYNLLSLGIPDINVKNETNELVSLFKNLYITNSSLNEYQKKRIIEDSLSNIVSDAVDANMFRFAKVSNMEDDNYYRLIKEANDEQQ